MKGIIYSFPKERLLRVVPLAGINRDDFVCLGDELTCVDSNWLLVFELRSFRCDKLASCNLYLENRWVREMNPR